MSQIKTRPRLSVFERASWLCMALAMAWFLGVVIYATVRHHGLL